MHDSNYVINLLLNLGKTGNFDLRSIKPLFQLRIMCSVLKPINISLSDHENSQKMLTLFYGTNSKKVY